MKKILVINAGSSTIKWKLFNKNDLHLIADGVADRIFVDGIVETHFRKEKKSRNVILNSHLEASQEIVKDLKSWKIVTDLKEISHIGFRVVQGGTIFDKTTIIDAKALQDIDDLSSLAPLHNPGAVQAIKSFSEIFKDAQLTATFDTAFHATIPAINYTYPIEKELVRKLEIRKYGMHGISHQYIKNQLELIFKKERVNFVNLHIGNGASLCAIKDSKSFDTSMGLTPLAGVMMGTRSGDIDPAIHGYVMSETGMSIKEFDHILLKESGLKGVSGVSQDMRDVTKAMQQGNKDAKFAIELYAQKIIDYLIKYINKVGEVDALVFTAGLGENSKILRQLVIDGIKIINLELNKKANDKIEGDVKLISTPESAIPIYVIRTNEELMIAQEALNIK